MAPVEDAKIESTIRTLVQQLYNTGNPQDLTVKRVRVAAEKQLGLPERWFRQHAAWKDRSDKLIKSTAQDLMDEDDEAEAEDEHEQVPAEQSPQPKGSSGTRKRVRDDGDQQIKRTHQTSQNKGREESTVQPTPAAANLSAKATKPRRNRRKPFVGTSDDEQQPEDSRDDFHTGNDDTSQDGVVESDLRLKTDEMLDSGSEPSSLIDSDPVRKRRKATKRGQAGDSRHKESRARNTDMQEDEVKKLKDWLKKCGIIKRWLELDKMGSAREKRIYLKRQLADVGMQGRYSLAKAKEIRERRELQQELEEAQRFESRWGNSKGKLRHAATSAANAMADMGLDLDDDDDDEDR